MNTEEIRCTLENDKATASMFLGVFPSDRLPSKIEKYPAVFVANTDPSTRPGEHWVAFYIDEDLEYFDSYGLPPLAVFRKFIEKYKYQKYNETTLQDYNTIVCGQYCIFFLHYRCLGYSMEEIVEFLNSKPNKNDTIVENFVKYSPIYAKCQTCCCRKY